VDFGVGRGEPAHGNEALRICTGCGVALTLIALGDEATVAVAEIPSPRATPPAPAALSLTAGALIRDAPRMVRLGGTHRWRWRGVWPALTLLGSVVACDSGSSDAGRAEDARRGEWVALAPSAAGSFEAGGRIAGVAAVVVWDERLAVVAAPEGSSVDLWLTADGRNWERRPFRPPDGCDPWGGVAVAGPLLVVSCHEIDGTSVSVAVTDDLDHWARRRVADAGPSFGTAVGLGPADALVVTITEARDVNTTKGAVVRVWVGGENETWTEVPGLERDAFVDAVAHRIRSFGDTVVITGAVNDWSDTAVPLTPRPAMWTSTAGSPFRRTLMPIATAGRAEGYVFDVAAIGSGFAAVGSDGGRGGLAWTSPDLRTWTPAPLSETPAIAGETILANLWSLAVGADGALVAGGSTSPSGFTLTWSSVDGRTWQPAGDGPQVVARWGDRIVGAGSGERLRVFEWRAPKR
jgi:hypothetical protein